MTEDFEKTESVEPEAELPSPFDELGASLHEEGEVVVAEEPFAPPPLPEIAIEEAVSEMEELAPPPLPEVAAPTEVLSTPSSIEAPSPPPEPEPAAPHQPITFGPPPDVSVAPLPAVDISPAEEAKPKKNNQTLIIVLIVVAVLLVLCCCCVLPIGWVLLNLEDIMYELQYMMLF